MLKLHILKTVAKVFKFKSITKVNQKPVRKPGQKIKWVLKKSNAEMGRWEVKSQSDGRRHYTVVLRGKDTLTCSCKGWIFNRHCKHIEAKAKELGIKIARRLTS